MRALVLTDLVDSTGLVEALGDLPAADLFAQVDRVTRDLVQQLGGLEIDRTDGFLLAFESPIDAVRFTLAIHAALEALSRTTGHTLLVRAGVHTGEVVLRANPAEDVARGAKPLEVEGLAKPFAARIMSCALGGQTLLSQTAFELASRSAVGAPDFADVTWASHGDWLLKGVSDPVPLHEVTRGTPRRPAKTDKAQPAGRRRRGWLGALAAMVILVPAMASVGWWWWLNPTLDHDTPVFTVHGAPVLYDDPTQQRRLERVWHDYLEGQSLRSANDFRHLLEAEQVPPELMAMTVFASSELGLEQADLGPIMRRVTPTGRGETGSRLCAGMIAEMFTMVANEERSPASIVQYAALRSRTARGLHAWLDRHPDDLLAVGCLHIGRESEEPGALMARMDAVDPEGRTPRVVGMRASFLAAEERFPEALEVIRVGQGKRPDAAALYREEAVLYNMSDRPEEALAVLRPRILEEPDRMDLRVIAAQVALPLGQEADFVEHLDVLMADHWPIGVHLLTLENVFRPLLREGRPRLALEVLKRANPDQWLCWEHTAYYATLPGYYTPETLLIGGQVLADELDVQGGIASAFQREWARSAMAMMQCFAAIKAGEPVDPHLESQAIRNERLSFAPSEVTAFLGGDLSPLEDLLVQYTDPEQLDANCGHAYLLATFRLAAGQRDAGLEALRTWLARDECVLLNTRAYRGLATGELALDAFERGDEAEAGRWVAAYHEAWPTAEPGLDIAIRLAAHGVQTGPQRLPALGVP